MVRSFRAAIARSLAVLLVSTAAVFAVGAESASAAVAKSCAYTTVAKPVGIGHGKATTRIAPVLYGSFPKGSVTHATVQFANDPKHRLYTVAAKGTSVRATHRAKDLVATAHVWVTSPSRNIVCRTWVRQPNSSGAVSVPDIGANPLATAEAKLKAAGLRWAVHRTGTSVYPYPCGVVVDYSPSMYQVVPRNSVVTVLVSC